MKKLALSITLVTLVMFAVPATAFASEDSAVQTIKEEPQTKLKR